MAVYGHQHDDCLQRSDCPVGTHGNYPRSRPDEGKKKSAEPVKAAAAAPAPAAAPAAASQDEVVAVITAAIMAMGYSSGQVASIRPVKNTGWTAAARISAVDTY